MTEWPWRPGEAIYPMNLNSFSWNYYTLTELWHLFPFSTDQMQVKSLPFWMLHIAAKVETKTWEYESAHQALSHSWEWWKWQGHPALPNCFREFYKSYFPVYEFDRYIRYIALPWVGHLDERKCCYRYYFFMMLFLFCSHDTLPQCNMSTDHGVKVTKFWKNKCLTISLPINITYYIWIQIISI